jgi:hypothetical protein
MAAAGRARAAGAGAEGSVDLDVGGVPHLHVEQVGRVERVSTRQQPILDSGAPAGAKEHLEDRRRVDGDQPAV